MVLPAATFAETSGTLVNAALARWPEMAAVGGIERAGIVHRLDKDTSGVIVLAKSAAALDALQAQFKARAVSKRYLALVEGIPTTSTGLIDAPIGRDQKQRKKMAVLYSESAKPAMTDYRVLERFRAHCLLQVKLHSGRTHQIRVHMAHIRHPVVGDPLYGGRLQIPAGCSEALREALRSFRRQALHAFRLGFEHPATGEWIEWEAPVPDDMEQLLSVLREDAKDA